MNTSKFLALLRIALGLMFVYAGITKIADSAWSSAGYLTNAQTFSGFYNWLASPVLLDSVNIVNECGLFLIGLALVLGIGIKYAAPLGALLMMLYYFPVLDFPYAGEHSYLIDEHIIYTLALLAI